MTAETEMAGRIAQMEKALAKTVELPPAYTREDANADSSRLAVLNKRWRKGTKLTDAEDAEEAHLTARRAVYYNSPDALADAQARRRKFDLMFRSFPSGFTAEEKREYDSLKARYPDGPKYGRGDPLEPAMKAIEEALKKLD